MSKVTFGKGSIVVTICIALSILGTSAAPEYMKFSSVEFLKAEENNAVIEQTASTKDLFEQLRLLLKINENGHCSCNDLSCECCQDVDIVHFHQKCCIKLTYNPPAGTAEVSLTVGGHTIWHNVFPVGKPPSTCFDFSGVQVCLDLYNFHLESRILSGCSKLSFKFFGHDIGHVELGCFRIHFLHSSIEAGPSNSIRILEAIRVIENAVFPINSEIPVNGEK